MIIEFGKTINGRRWVSADGRLVCKVDGDIACKTRDLRQQRYYITGKKVRYMIKIKEKLNFKYEQQTRTGDSYSSRGLQR